MRFQTRYKNGSIAQSENALHRWVRLEGNRGALTEPTAEA
jgi:hypothetical protein